MEQSRSAMKLTASKNLADFFCITIGFLFTWSRWELYNKQGKFKKIYLQGDEDNINKHLSLVLDENSGHYEFLKIMKLLTHVSNINQVSV